MTQQPEPRALGPTGLYVSWSQQSGTDGQGRHGLGRMTATGVVSDDTMRGPFTLLYTVES